MDGWSASLSRTEARPSPVVSMTWIGVPAPRRTPPRSYCQSVSSDGTSVHPSPADAAHLPSDLCADVGGGCPGADGGDVDVGVAALLDDDDLPCGGHVGEPDPETGRDVP